MAGTRAPRTPRKPRAPKAETPAKVDTPTPAGSATDTAAEALLLDGGWKKLEDGTWYHQRKSRGNFLPVDAAHAMEMRARDAAAELPLPEIDGSQLGVDVKSPAATLTADELAAAGGAPSAPADVEQPTQPEPATPPPPLQTADSLAHQADAEAREAALERAERERVFAHDGIGGVTIWSCDHCHANVRYAAFCTCDRCESITAVDKSMDAPCPFCGHGRPHGNR